MIEFPLFKCHPIFSLPLQISAQMWWVGGATQWLPILVLYCWEGHGALCEVLTGPEGGWAHRPLRATGGTAAGQGVLLSCSSVNSAKSCRRTRTNSPFENMVLGEIKNLDTTSSHSHDPPLGFYFKLAPTYMILWFEFKINKCWSFNCITPLSIPMQRVSWKLRRSPLCRRRSSGSRDRSITQSTTA